MDDYEIKKANYYKTLDADKTIPKLKIGQKYIGLKSNKIYIVYFNDEEQRIAMKRIEKKSHFLDCHLDMFEWDLLRIVEE